MNGLLSPLFVKRRRVGVGHTSRMPARPGESQEDGGALRRYHWVTGREGIFSEPAALLIGVLIREAARKGAESFSVVPGGLATIVTFSGSNTKEVLLLRRHHAPLLTRRLRDLCGIPESLGVYPQQGAMAIHQKASRMGIKVELSMTPWGEQATVTVARAEAAPHAVNHTPSSPTA